MRVAWKYGISLEAELMMWSRCIGETHYERKVNTTRQKYSSNERAGTLEYSFVLVLMN